MAHCEESAVKEVVHDSAESDEEYKDTGYVMPDISSRSEPGCEDEEEEHSDVSGELSPDVYAEHKKKKYRNAVQDKQSDHGEVVDKDNEVDDKENEVDEVDDKENDHGEVVDDESVPTTHSKANSTVVSDGKAKGAVRKRDGKTKEKTPAKPKPFQCQECEKTYASKQSLSRHVKHEHRNEFSHNCEICQMGFRAVASFRAHMKKTHDEEMPTRPKTPKRTKSKPGLNESIVREADQEAKEAEASMTENDTEATITASETEGLMAETKTDENMNVAETPKGTGKKPTIQMKGNKRRASTPTSQKRSDNKRMKPMEPIAEFNLEE